MFACDILRDETDTCTAWTRSVLARCFAHLSGARGKQVWGISETRDQNYHSNARPRFRLADLLLELVILCRHSER